MHAPPITPSIEVTIGRESRLYHAFITTAPLRSTRRQRSRSTQGRFPTCRHGSEPNLTGRRANASARLGSWTAPSWPGSALDIANGVSRAPTDPGSLA